MTRAPARWTRAARVAARAVLPEPDRSCVVPTGGKRWPAFRWYTLGPWRPVGGTWTRS